MILLKFDTVTSTMDVCKEFLSQYAPPICVVAKNQTAGRGRGNNSWKNVAEGFYGTFGFKNQAATDGLSVYFGYRILKALNLTQEKALIKWPNDLVVAKTEKKFCGILVEIWEDYILTGIGLNLRANGEFGSLIDLDLELNADQALEILCSVIVDAYDEFKNDQFELPIEDIWKYDFFKGRWITAKDEAVKLLPLGLTRSGALVCMTAAGAYVELVSASQVRVCD